MIKAWEKEQACFEQYNPVDIFLTNAWCYVRLSPIPLRVQQGYQKQSGMNGNVDGNNRETVTALLLNIKEAQQARSIKPHDLEAMGLFLIGRKVLVGLRHDVYGLARKNKWSSDGRNKNPTSVV